VLNASSATANVGSRVHDHDHEPGRPDAAAAVVHVVVANFTITASAGANGTIAPSGAVSVPTAGARASRSRRPPATTFADVLVDGGSVGAVALHVLERDREPHDLGELRAGVPAPGP